MPTDYILFIHGVNTREEETLPSYANSLIKRLRENFSLPGRTFVPLVVYWGGVNDEREAQLRNDYQASPLWEKLWFKDMRETQILRFTGDTALYISRHLGGRVAEIVAREIAKIQENGSTDDRLHLVSHSLGTVILFDLLFSARWDLEGVPGYESVLYIRDKVYGVTGKRKDPTSGICLGSVTTMGSPIGIFSLMSAGQCAKDTILASHDITPRLEQLLNYLYVTLKRKKLPWLNLIHPGDPIASPLEALLYRLVDGTRTYIDIEDMLVPAALQEMVIENFSEVAYDLLNISGIQAMFALLCSGIAHGSYWQSQEVARQISQMLQKSWATSSRS